MYAKVMFSFPGTQKNEMPLTKGEIIPITHKGKARWLEQGPKGRFSYRLCGISARGDRDST